MEQQRPELLFRNRRLVVCVKTPGQLSEPGSASGLPEQTAAALTALGEPGEVLTVHRLDKPVGGLTVLARDPEAAGDLIEQFRTHAVEKDYYAVLRGIPPQPSGVLEDLLFHDSSRNKTYVVQRPRKGVRKASLTYRTLGTVKEGETDLTLVRIRLHTGRTHQIRAQFSARGLPLLGDVRYGGGSACDPALWSCFLRLRDPASQRTMTFSLRPPEKFPWDLFPRDAYQPYTPFQNRREEVTP